MKLVLNRKFASNGQPYWLCEMRFDEDDVEVRNDLGTRDEALANCARVWGLKSIHPQTEDHDLSPGQHVYYVHS